MSIIIIHHFTKNFNYFFAQFASAWKKKVEKAEKFWKKHTFREKNRRIFVNLANIFYQKLEIFLDFAQIDKNSAKKNAKKA